ncbi:MAG: NAD(P)-dependent oxidoreductase [Chloroflexi bacterium]|nr:NAD(P)-dependent oxidoreductase [Chloroflexota bacterium]
MRIAVTGGSGFIGSRLAVKLAQLGHQVTAVDIKPSSLPGCALKLADLTDMKQTIEALKDTDVVYHLGGFVLEGVRKNPCAGTTLNVNGTLNVLEACKANQIKKVLFASTFYVYDGIPDTATVNEDSPLDLLKMELFGATKLMSEALIKEYTKKGGLEYVILRLGSVYGPGNCTNVVRTFVESALAGKSMDVWGSGKRSNQYTLLDDVVDGCILALDKVNETYNLISPERTSIKELADLLEKKYHFQVSFDATKKEGASTAYMSAQKAIEKLGWKPTTLEKGVEKTVAEIKRAA